MGFTDVAERYDLPMAGLRRIRQDALRSNTYLLAAPGAADPGSDCVVVDPGLDRGLIEAELSRSGWRPRAVLCTHGHFDHVGSSAWLQQAHGIPVLLPIADLKLAKLANFMMTAFKLPHRIAIPDFTLLSIQEDQPVSIEFIGRNFTFHALPGHTPGSAGILVDGLLFSGDTLYARQTALSKLPGEDHAQLRHSLRRLFKWIDGQVHVLPGHGDSASIADILTNNEALRTFMACEQVA